MNHRVWSVVALSMFVGCAHSGKNSSVERYYRNKPLTPPAVYYCNDHVDHLAGAKPFILGGRCTCTPTAPRLKVWQRDGYFRGLTLGEVKQRYARAGIATTDDHKGCNNMCRYGPHVVQGGRCMVPPTPGTTHYEEVLSGRIEKQNRGE